MCACLEYLGSPHVNSTFRITYINEGMNVHRFGYYILMYCKDFFYVNLNVFVYKQEIPSSLTQKP